MARGTQADIGGLRVDRPMWSGPAGLPREGGTPSGRPPDPDRPRRLPKMRQYLPPTPTPTPGRTVGAQRAPVRPPVDIDLTADDPARRTVDIDLTRAHPSVRGA